MPNPFEQFLNDPPGVAPQGPSGPQAPSTPDAGNPFTQFLGDRPGIETVPLPQPRPQPQQPLGLYQSVYENTMLGAEQRAVPHPDVYNAPLATGKDVFVNDAGEISFKDAQGNEVPTDRTQHVILQGPQGLSVYARTPQTRESPVEGVSRVLSLGLGAPTPGVPTVAAEATIPGLRRAATSVYRDPGTALKPVDPATLDQAFQELRPQLRLTDPRIVEQIRKELIDIEPNINGLNIASERLGVIAGQYTKDGATKAAAAAQAVKTKIDQVIRTIAPEMQTADENYAAMKATQGLINRGEKAEIQARGGDFAKRMETQATQLLLDKRAMRAFTPEEADMIGQLSRGELQGEGLKNAANWLSGKLGTALSVGGALAGYEHSGLVTGAASFIGGAAIDPAVTAFLTRWGNRLASDQINAISSAVRARSPLGQELATKVATFSDTQNKFLASKSMGTLTALRQSARELSLSLRRIGVDIHPAQLMRVESLGPSQADERQQGVPGPATQ